MKTLIITVFCLLLGLSTQAQGFRVGARAGVNFATQRLENEALDQLNIDFNTQYRTAWQAGVAFDIAITGNFWVQPAVIFSSKGYRFDESNDLLNLKVESRPLYLHLPVPFLIRTDFSGVNPFVGFGPYFGIGIGGRIDSEGDLAGLEFAQAGDVDWGSSDNDDYRTLDTGFLLTGGIERKGLQLALAYEFGLSNIIPDRSRENLVRNRVFSITLSFFPNPELFQ